MRLQNSHTVTSDCNRVMVHRTVIPFTAMSGPQPSARAAARVPAQCGLRWSCSSAPQDDRSTIARRCRSVIAENARKRGQAWSVCTSCAQAIEDDARQLEIAPATPPCDAWCAGRTSPTSGRLREGAKYYDKRILPARAVA